ncbi:hypothetical protein F5Y15DRAFT_325930 [Xylariaceae sp. FL0016]|nr:hypothetical protein F5Y15DRAFT_325930 [Xylariaceae sp. FL0016]
MSTEDSTYAPKSPDLTFLYSGAEAASTSGSPDIHSPQKAAAAHPLQQYGHHQLQPHQYQSQFDNTYQLSPQPPTGAAYNNIYSPHSATASHPAQYLPPQHPEYAQPSHHQDYQPQDLSAPLSYYTPYTDSTPITTYAPNPTTQSFHHQQPSTANHPATGPSTSNAMPPRKAAPAAKEAEIMPSPVKTKFPTARIKRIMQADEEVGKVAQQTPIAVGKALELFMVQLVTKSAEVAKERNSKRITAPMLKQAIDSANEWDFLQDIVSKVTEEKEGAKSSGKAKAESSSDEDPDAGEVKKKARGGRKRKAPA